MKHSILWMVILVGGLSSGVEARTWALVNGRKLEAEFVHVMGEEAVLRDMSGGTVKVRLTLLSPEDRLFIELENPPQFKISFRRKTKKKDFSTRFPTKLLPEIQINTFGVRIKQKSAGFYGHELHVELFAIGKERAGDRFILLDRQANPFFFTLETRRTHEFWGREVELDEYEIFYISRPRGKKYAGHLIVVTDARGKTIATQVTHGWLLENIGNLKKMPIGGYMDKTCTRTFPTRPKPCRY